MFHFTTVRSVPNHCVDLFHGGDCDDCSVNFGMCGLLTPEMVNFYPIHVKESEIGR